MSIVVAAAPPPIHGAPVCLTDAPTRGMPPTGNVGFNRKKRGAESGAALLKISQVMR